MIDSQCRSPDNGDARQEKLPGVRRAGRISHPAIAGGTTDGKASVVPVAHDNRLGVRPQAPRRVLTGGRAEQSVRFPT